MASGDLMVQWGALANEAPASGYATFDQRNGQPCLDHDAAATEGCVFSGILPGNYAGGGLTVYIVWAASTATSGNVVWGSAIERRNTDNDTDSFATQQTATGAANGTSGIFTTTSIAHSSGANMDSLAANEPFRVQVQRLGANGSDTMTGDAEVYSVYVRET